MKIKLGFVTNSSSTSYLVFIPDGFDIFKFLHLINSEYRKKFENEEEKKYDEEIVLLFKELLKLGRIYQYDRTELFYGIAEILSKLDLCVFDWQSSSEDGQVYNINYELYKKEIDRIKKGGWGIKHGGWGQKSGV